MSCGNINGHSGYISEVKNVIETHILSLEIVILQTTTNRRYIGATMHRFTPNIHFESSIAHENTSDWKHIVIASAWPILGTETVLLPTRRDPILLIFDTSGALTSAKFIWCCLFLPACTPFLGQICIFVISKRQNDCVSSQYQRYRTTGMEMK